jgi:hypothetical protein
MLGYWTDRWYHAMHSSMKLRIEFKNRYIIPYTVIFINYEWVISQKYLKFYGLLQFLSELLALVTKNVKWIFISIASFSKVCTWQGTCTEPTSIWKGNKDKGVDDRKKKDSLDD